MPTSRHIHVRIGKGARRELVLPTDNIGVTESTTRTLTPAPVTGDQKYVGVYNSGENPRYSISGTALNLATGYIRFIDRISTDGSGRYVTALNNGLDLIMAVDSKHPVGGTTTWEPYTSFTAGTWDANWTTLRSDALSLLASHPDRWIALAWIHEMDLRTVGGSGGGAGKAASDTAATYVPSANRFADFMHAGGNPRLKVCHWIQSPSGADAYLPDKTKFDLCSSDPYKTGTECAIPTLTGIMKETADWYDSHGWTTQDRFITETGIKTNAFSGTQCGKTSYSEADQLTFWNSMKAALDDPVMKFRGLVFFECFGDNHDYRPVFPSIEPAFAAQAAAIIAE